MGKVISTSIPEYIYDFCKKKGIKPRELILIGYTMYALSLEKMHNEDSSTCNTSNN